MTELPRHIAVIMDGNGRWASRRLMPRIAGHRAGMKRMISLTEEIFSRGIGCCTLFALSTENLSRPAGELEGLYGLFREYFKEQTARLKAQGVSLKILGDLSLLPEDIGALARSAEAETAGGGKILAIALGYGARQDIVRACNEAIARGTPVTLESFAATLSTGGMPALDLLIRTGKEKRISNFLLFEAAYAELYFSEKLFPDFSARDLTHALEAYAKRDRRFGRIS